MALNEKKTYLVNLTFSYTVPCSKRIEKKKEYGALVFTFGGNVES